MRTSMRALYAFRLAFGQSSQVSSQSAIRTYATENPDKLVTRSATVLAVFGFALSSFSVKQMLASSGNKPSTMPIQKF